MKNKVLKGLTAALCAVMVISSLAGCGSSGDKSADAGSDAAATEEASSEDAPKDSADKGTVVVGSKDFSESLVTAELYALALEDAGYKVDRKFGLAGEAGMDAMKSGDIDIFPEYTGTGLVHELQADPIYDDEEAYEAVKKGYKEKWDIDWLTPSKVNDTTCYIMKKDVADELGIKTLSDAQKHSNQLIFGYHADTPDKADYKKMLEIYGDFNYKEMIQIEDQLKYSALDSGEINFTEALTTDPKLASGEYIVIEQDIPYDVTYYLTPIVRGEVLSANPDIADILNGVSAKLDNDTMVQLVSKVDIDKEEAEDAAADFYKENFSK